MSPRKKINEKTTQEVQKNIAAKLERAQNHASVAFLITRFLISLFSDINEFSTVSGFIPPPCGNKDTGCLPL